MPCDADSGTFACGLNNSCDNAFKMKGGDSFVLRASQIAALVHGASTNSTTSSTTASATASNTKCPEGTYTGGALAGVGLGIGLPLFFALVTAIWMLRKEKARHAPKGMYDLPDEPAVPLPRLRRPSYTSTLQRSGTMKTTHSQMPLHHPPTFMERYGGKEDLAMGVQEMDLGVPTYTTTEIHELGVTSPGSSPPYSERERGELAEIR